MARKYSQTTRKIGTRNFQDVINEIKWVTPK
jgi:hypothetical protein